MNWGIFASIASLLGILATVGSVAFWSGKLTEKIKFNADTTVEILKVQGQHREMLDDQGLKIDRLEQWRNGYNAAANISGAAKVE